MASTLPALPNYFLNFAQPKSSELPAQKEKAQPPLLYKILRGCGFDALLAGNVGKPTLDILPKIGKKTFIILKLSSFQLQDLKQSPQVAVVTDTFPNHMDTYKTMQEYLTAKANICAHQGKYDSVFYFSDNTLSKKIAQKSCGFKIGVTGHSFGLKKNFVMAATVARLPRLSAGKNYFHAEKF